MSRSALPPARLRSTGLARTTRRGEWNSPRAPHPGTSRGAVSRSALRAPLDGSWVPYGTARASLTGPLVRPLRDRSCVPYGTARASLTGPLVCPLRDRSCVPYGTARVSLTGPLVRPLRDRSCVPYGTARVSLTGPLVCPLRDRSCVPYGAASASLTGRLWRSSRDDDACGNIPSPTRESSGARRAERDTYRRDVPGWGARGEFHSPRRVVLARPVERSLAGGKAERDTA